MTSKFTKMIVVPLAVAALYATVSLNYTAAKENDNRYKTEIVCEANVAHAETKESLSVSHYRHVKDAYVSVINNTIEAQEIIGKYHDLMKDGESTKVDVQEGFLENLANRAKTTDFSKPSPFGYERTDELFGIAIGSSNELDTIAEKLDKTSSADLLSRVKGPEYKPSKDEADAFNTNCVLIWKQARRLSDRIQKDSTYIEEAFR